MFDASYHVMYDKSDSISNDHAQGKNNHYVSSNKNQETERTKPVLEHICFCQEMLPKDVILFLDGFRPGNDANVVGCFCKTSGKDFLTKQKTTFHILYDEESLQARRKKQQGVLNLLEGALAFSKDVLNIPRKKRLHYLGHTYSSVIGPVAVPPFTSEVLWLVIMSLLCASNELAINC